NSADLYVMTYPGGPARALSHNSSPTVERNFWEIMPDWSPDGTALLYASDRGRVRTGTLDLAAWRLTLSNGTRVQISSANAYTGGIDRPRWRPRGGDDLLFTSWTYDPNTLEPYGQLTVLDLRTRRLETLTAPNETGMQASWSPDGAHVVFVKRESGRDDIWVLPVSETQASRAAGNGPPGETPVASPGPEAPPAGAGWRVVAGMNAQPAWSPDGRALAYIALVDGSFDLFVQLLDADLRAEGPPRQLTHGWRLDGASSVAWGR
ncbi:MAG: PD40 domain-containing protein, partial [Chloroflexota bacterium]|nr:PD40 domain-containing protein [Chloroflexota bacterium]